MKPKFSIVLIAKNEENCLPKLFASLEDFKRRGGEVCLLDTGSKDATIKIAKEWGAKVFEGRFTTEIHEEVAKKINKKFLDPKDGNVHIVEKGQQLFNFAAARNFINSKAENDMICTLDADEAYTTFDVDKINQAIDEGFTQFDYQFVYAHDQFGKPVVEFVQSKFFNRTLATWTGIVHEVVTGRTKNKYLDASIIKLEHYQEPNKPHRGGYLPGLALDCFENPGKDRQSHYFARELMYTGKYYSAIKEFKRHIVMDAWPAERAQSMIHIADCYGASGETDQQIEWLHKTFDFDNTKRSALIKLAFIYKSRNNYVSTAAYAAAAMEVPWADYYANNLPDYEDLPHGLMYWAKGWLGDVAAAKEHILKALDFQPYNQDYLRDTKFYFDYPDNGIQGWMCFNELQFLYETAKTHEEIAEIGSWKGKSTHALLKGQLAGKYPNGHVMAVDTWEGSLDTRDHTNFLAKQEDVFSQFKENVGHFKNLFIVKGDSFNEARKCADKSFDFIFIDAGHTYEEVKQDIEAWLPKLTKNGIMAGHDYLPQTWMGVCQAVDEKFGRNVQRAGYSIWYVDFSKLFTFETTIEFADHLKDTPLMGTPFTIEYKDPNYMKRIPQKIYTAWLSEDPMPELIQKCIESQKIPGYEHTVIDLNNVHYYAGDYVRQAIAAKKWVKAVDFLRMTCLYKGGIFLDADVEILPGKNFDCLLTEKMFVGKEANLDGGIILGTAVIGASPEHPFIKDWMDQVQEKFRGDDDFYYESSMDLLNTIGVKYQDQFKILEPDIFYPYNHLTGQTNKTEMTVALHHFMKTWIPENSKPPKPANKPELKFQNLLRSHIKTETPFVFIKKGDGELACMNGEKGSNCDRHPYTEKLAEDLKKSFHYFDGKPNCYVVNFEDQKNYNCLLHRDDNDPSSFWDAVSKDKREKFFIGPIRLYEVLGLLHATHVDVPEFNAYDSLNKILARIPKQENAIYIFSAGMPAKVLIHILHEYMPEATYIDAGSSFDALAGMSRTHQLTRNQLLTLYPETKDWYPGPEKIIMGDFDEHEVVNNFALPQETHPERLFVLEHIPAPHGLHIMNVKENVIDIGCGSNKTMHYFTGVDVRPVTDLQCSMDQISSDNGTFDIAISRHSLEHVLDPVKTLREWMRILKDNGKIIVVLPDHGKINTIDPYYSNGEHLHAYSIESFKNFISLFPNLFLQSIGVIIENWSFGAVMNYNLPMVSIIIPTLARPEGLQRCKDSIEKLIYPKLRLEVIVIEGDDTVPEKMKRGFQQAGGDIICYAANDIEFTLMSLIRAVEMSRHYALVAFNTGEVLEDKGNICEHFILSRHFIENTLQGVIFDTRLKHCGVDNLLWKRADQAGQAVRCEKAIVKHYHFSKPGGHMDEVYKKGWANVHEDRKILKQLLENY